MIDVVALGELLIDFAAKSTDSAGYPTMAANPGGAPGNFLAALNAYGRKTAFLGKVGNDAFGNLLLGTLNAAGIETKGILVDDSVFTTLAFVTFDESGDRAFSFARKPGADTQLRWEEVDKSLIDEAKVFHFGTLSLTDEPVRTATQKAVAYAKAQGKLISCDPNLRLPLWPDADAAKEQMLWSLRQADVVKISDNEVEFLWNCTPEEGADKLLTEFGVSLAMVTLGPDGCLLKTRTAAFRAVCPKVHPVDTTGAGDIFGGSASFIQSKLSLPAALAQQAEQLAAEGKTPLFFGGAGRLLGVIAVADTIKADSPEAIRQLQNMGIRVVMLTGDNQRTADAIGRQAGVDEVIAGVLPDGKEAVIRQLQASGKVAMVGDGINDAPALTRADTGIAIGAGTDVAIDAADVVLMNSRLSDVPAAIRLSRAALQNIHENLFWAFIYNIIGIPLAAGLFIPFGLTLNPMFGAAAMSLSSFCVVSNALRLNLFDLHSTKHDHKKASPAAVSAQSAAENNTPSDTEAPDGKMEDDPMKKTLNVEGMMCCHCEARVKKALEAIPGVSEAVASHTDGTAVVTLTEDVADDVLKNAVEAQDYKVTGIQ